MANPFPFVAGDVLTAAELNSIGEAAVSFTPTFTNYTRGNGTSVAYYMQVNKLVYVYVFETLGSTSSVTGSISMTLPVAAVRAESVQSSVVRINDTGSFNFTGLTSASSTTSMSLFFNLVVGTSVQVGIISATEPMTWASTDTFRYQFVYEVA
jgi:hypothetical protein